MRFCILKRYSAVRMVFLAFLLLQEVSANGQSLQASFQADVSSGCAPLIVQFQNTSVGASVYSWQFGNGNYSSDPNPNYVFSIPGTYTVVLTASQGNSNSTYSQTLTVHPSPFADFTVNQTSGCQESAPFQFSNLSTGFDSCIWDFGDGLVSYLQNPVHTYDTSGVFTVKLLVYNSQTGCQKVKISSNLITVFPKPRAFVVMSDSQSCDAAHAFQFGLSALQNVSTWHWDFGSGPSGNQQVNVQHVFADTGFHLVSLMLTSPLGCTDTVYAPHPVHISYNPVPSVNIHALTGCQPLGNAFSTVANPLATYTWTIGNGLTRPGATVYYTYQDTGTYPVSLTATYLNGCQNTVSAGPVVVLGRPSFVFGMSNNVGCTPLSVSFQNNQSSSNYSWMWDFGDGDSSTLALPPPHVYDLAGTYTVTLTATAQNGCTLSYPLNPKVLAYGPVAGINADLVSGCPPMLVNFSNTSTYANAYQWDFGDGTISSAQHPSHVYATPGTYLVRLIARDTTSGCSDTVVYNTPINVGAAQVNYQAPPPVTGCAPFGVNFSDASGAVSYLWDFGDGNTSQLANPYHVYSVPGTYVVSLTTTSSANGCEYHIPDFQTFIIDGADPGFTYTVSQCPPYVVQFNDTTANAVAWNWVFGSGGSSTMQHPTHVFPGPGVYNVTLHATTPGGCQTTLQANGAVQITGLGAYPAMICTDTVAPFNAQFYANSTQATWWYWDFGDGSTDSSENPLHVYNGSGPFALSLTIGNDSCSYTYSYPPITFGSTNSNPGGLGGGIPYTPPVSHCAPYTVDFSNPDPTAVAYLWDFGDGTTSTLSSPSHTYLSGGIFVPMVFIQRANGATDSVFLGDTILVNDPVTDFQVSTTPLCRGLRVDVASSVPGATYLWDFGAGVTFNTPAASYSYPNISAAYQVSLNLTDSNACKSYIVKSFRVSATGDLKASRRRACAGDTITFDPGVLQFASYSWDFGDGNTSNAVSPSHTYSNGGAYQVNLNVTDVNGCVRRYTMPYLVNVYKPEASFSMTGPQTNCQVFTYWFHNSSQGSSNWIWSANGTFFSNAKDPVKHFSTPGTYDITLTAYENICSSSFTITNAFYISQLSADFQFSMSENCSPAIATFNDLSVDAVSWHWNFGDGAASTVTNPVHTYINQPTDSITLTIKDVNGCSKQKRLPPPLITKAEFSCSAPGGCAPWQTSFINLSTHVNSCQWDFGNGQVDSSWSPSQTYLTDGFYGVSLVVTGPTGCTDTLVVDSLIEVNTPVAQFTADTVLGCAPLFVQYTDQSTNPMAYSWDFGNGSVSTSANPNKLYSEPGVYSTQLVVTNKFGCKDTLTADSLIRVLGPQPGFEMDLVSGCTPLQVNFTNTSIDGLSYQWYFGDGLTDSAMNTSHVFVDSGDFAVSLYVVDSNGCYSVYTHPVHISAAASPVPGFYTDVLSGCAPLTIFITDTTSFADSLVWEMGDGQILHGPVTNYTYATPGIYRIKLIAFNGDSCSAEQIMTDSVVVGSRPVVNFSSDVTEGCPPLQVVFSSLCSQLDDPVFNWTFGNGDTGIGPQNQIVFSDAGSYPVKLVVTNSGGCSDSLELTNFITVFDTLPPAPVRLRRVSVEPGVHVSVEWFGSTEVDVDYYEVLRLDPVTGFYDSLGSVTHASCIGLPFASFVDHQVATASSNYTYKVRAVDKCGYTSSVPDSLTHTTILLNSQAGLHQVQLSWSPYEGCEVGAYRIWRANDFGSAFELIGEVTGAMSSYVDSTSWCPFDYQYRIEATPLCGNSQVYSLSNVVTSQPVSQIQSQRVDIVRSTVVDDRYVLTEWSEPDVLPQAVLEYLVYRSEDGINFNSVGSVPAGIYSYDDRAVDVDWNRYIFRIQTRNVCDVQTDLGRIGSSILLEKSEAGSVDFLKWTQYVDWDTGIEKYVIQKLNEQGQWVDEKVFPPTITDWEVE